MGWDGSGNASVPYPDFVAGTTARSAEVDANNADIVTMLENCVTRDGQNAASANLPMGNFRHTGVGNASARNHYAAAGQVQDGAFAWCGTAGGTADALTLSPTPAITAYAAGQVFRFIASATNTGAATVAVSGLTAQAIQANGAALAAGEITSGAEYELLYDGTQFQILASSRAAAGEFAAMTVGTIATSHINGGPQVGPPVPVGSIFDYAGASAPSGWLLCFGQNVSRTTYAALFDVLGTTYGVGDGSTTFGIPDLRGRVVAGQDDMGGTSANRLTGLTGGVDGDTLGASGGAETHTLTVSELADHGHGIPGGATAVPSFHTTGAFTDQGVSGSNPRADLTATLNAGSNGAHNNVQPTFILNKIVYAGA